MAMSIIEFDANASQALDVSRFIVHAPLELRWLGPVNEEVFWEMFHGRLLDHTMTRRKQRFRAWNIYVADADEPLISIKFDEANQRIHVTRAVRCYAFATTALTPDVIESAPTTRWVRELVGTVQANQIDELSNLVFHAVVGTGRLPLTSLEAPLPAFTFGQLGYFHDDADPEVATKRLEFDLRCGKVPTGQSNFLPRLREVFLSVSLSPYTDFVAKVLSYLRESKTDELDASHERLSFLGYLLRLQWRHLNAYDLVTFHHRGANYPDALLIDEVMREMLAIAERTPEAFDNRLVRRGLRLGWLLHSMYAGQPAPEQPTSPGENQRVLPEPFIRIPEEQILLPHRRPRTLFAEPLPLTAKTKSLLASCVAELAEPIELRELGTALILDRPLGIGKSKFEPDRTPMFSHVVQSRKLTANALEVVRDAAERQLDFNLRANLDDVEITGVPLPRLEIELRPGVVTLADAWRRADDFVLTATTKGSVRRFQQCFDWSNCPTVWNVANRWHLAVPTSCNGATTLTVYDDQHNPWLVLRTNADEGFRLQRGVEVPVGGLTAVETQSNREYYITPVQ